MTPVLSRSCRISLKCGSILPLTFMVMRLSLSYPGSRVDHQTLSHNRSTRPADPDPLEYIYRIERRQIQSRVTAGHQPADSRDSDHRRQMLRSRKPQRQLPAPSTFLTPTSRARRSLRAVARFIKLMQAINKMIHAITVKRCTYWISPPACLPATLLRQK